MAEVAQIPWNGLTAASTFSGAGGSSLGYRMAGFKVVYCNEFVEAARETYRANAPDYVVVDDRDIRKVTGAEIREMVGEIDLLDGSPPCAAFSTQGRREKGWGQVRDYSDTSQRVDDLFFDFVRILKELQPKVFVAENVAGLVVGKAIGYFKLILAALRDCGYKVEARVLDASRLGVPQLRHRLIFIGVRNDLPFGPVFPKPLPYQYSIAEAICPDGITTGDTLRTDPETGYDLCIPQTTKLYQLWRQLSIGSAPTGSYFNLCRADPHKPSQMLGAAWGANSVASPAHWEYPRKFSLQELRALASFPADFELTGTYKQRWERIGRAVPPLMMKAVAQAIAEPLIAAAATAEQAS
jgi:DNA (cytosine-5)-methyltransferase 1